MNKTEQFISLFITYKCTMRNFSKNRQATGNCKGTNAFETSSSQIKWLLVK